MKNQTSLSSMFVILARSSQPRYITHYDFPNNKWNVFLLQNGKEEFVQPFDLLEDAESFCSINNGVIASVGGE